MFERLADLESEFDALEARLSDIYASGDQDAVRTAGKRHAELKPIVDAFRELRTARSQLDEAREMLRSEADAEMRELAREEMAEKESAVADLEGRLKVLLLPKDPNDDKNVILEVRGAEGGEEANLFAGDLVRMYQAYAEQPAAGRSRCSPASRRTWAASRRPPSWSRAPACGAGSSTRPAPTGCSGCR